MPDQTSVMTPNYPKRVAENPVFKLLPSIAAPLIVVFSGTAYFSGFIYRLQIADFYGVSGSIVTDPIQTTIARGYAIDIIGFAVLAATQIVILLIPRWLWSISFGRNRPRRTDWFQRLVAKNMRRSRLLLWLTLSMLLATFGAFAGNVAALVKGFEVESKLANGCAKCFLYNTSRGRLVGVVVMQDDKLTVFATRTGVALVKNSEIKAARRITSHSVWHW